jgi:predicted YcjX-like family ATPase
VTPLAVARGLLPVRQTVRIGVTGLARSGKTAFLTSVAANLLADGAGLPALPAFAERLGGRSLRVALAPAGADTLPRFDHLAHVAALAGEPPRWPGRTGAVSLLALDLEIGHDGLAAALPPRRLRLELLDYPGEWLLDLPLLGQSFADWSQATLRRLQGHQAAHDFLAFAHALPAAAPAEETLARAGHDLYRTLLRTLRDAERLTMLQPGRFLMPAPGPEPPWTAFFPLTGTSRLVELLRDRFDAYVRAVRRDLIAPGFGRVDRLVVLADVLAALHGGAAAFADAAAALAAVAGALRWRRRLKPLPGWLTDLLPAFRGIDRVAFVATKADHVAARQRGNLAALVRRLADVPGLAEGFAIAAIRCTEDVVWTLEGRPVSAVRGRVVGEARPGRSYPGEVPDHVPDAAFWTFPFLALPDFEPMRLPLGGRGGVGQIALDALLVFLLEDLL